MTYLLAGGGTGGHLAPGIAVAEELSRLDQDSRCIFVGAGRAIEQRMLGGTTFDCVPLSAQPLSSLKRRPIDFVRGNFVAVRAAMQLVRELRPRAVIGLGGYASVPIVLAAAMSGVPVWLLEQNAIPGRANRWLSHWFPICVSFASSVGWLPIQAQVHVTGNPLRRSLLHAFRETPQRPSSRSKTLLVMGGSQGSSSVNRDVLAVVAALKSQLSDWRIVHQAGEPQCEAVRASYQQLGLRADVQPFFSNVTELYAAARLIVCRAGATTLTEIAIAGLPAVLIPYPHAADQHQVENARVFVDGGAAYCVIERDATTTQQELLTLLSQLHRDDERLDLMSNSMRSLARPEAAADVARLVAAKARQ